MEPRAASGALSASGALAPFPSRERTGRPGRSPRFRIDRVVYVRRVAFFDGFAVERIDGGAGATLRVRQGGYGQPVVLLHGHPRTHATWHAVAARLAPHHHVVCPDLRGYG